MDSFEWNKIIGGVLGAVLLILVIKVVAEVVYEPEKPAKPGYIVEGVVETTGGGTAAPVEEPLPDFGTVLAKADAGNGKAVSVKCEACHDLAKGGAVKIGPPLYGVVGRARASVPGFSYSSAMMSDHTPWTFASLFKYLKSPQVMVPGTKMSFAGLSRAQDRIDLIAFLRTNSDSPVEIPPPAPATAPSASPAAASSSNPAPAGAEQHGPNPGGPTPAAAPPSGTPAVEAPAGVAVGKSTSGMTEKAPANPAKNSRTGN